jgi:threonine synthase
MQNAIKYYSTNLKAELVSFKDALLKGLAPDGGLFMPDVIPRIQDAEIDSYRSMSYPEIAYMVSHKFLHTELPDNDLQEIVKDAYNYEVPLEHVYERKYVMRLDMGPTASFKDFAARMMGRLMNYYLLKDNRKLLILTATSGDTGSAIANAFYGLDNIKVVVLFPINEVTKRQRKQMTTLGKNVQIISIDGKFDDCQALVKKAFSDKEISYLNLSSANSINIGRLIPQIIYYFYAFAKLGEKGVAEDAVFSVPSGNFGDMMGGMLAKKMGLPVKRYIIATNENDEFPRMLETGEYQKIEPSRNCISSAMNVGHPSNVPRLIALYGGVMDEKGNMHKAPDFKRMREDIYAVSIDDVETRETIKSAYEQYRLLLEPHGSVGWAGLQNYLRANKDADSPEQLFISLETAHPAKFPEEITKILGFDPDLSESLKGIEEKPEEFLNLKNDYSTFKSFLKDNYK